MIVKLLKDWPRQRETMRAGTEVPVPWALANSLIKKRMAVLVKGKASKADASKVLPGETSAAEAEKAEKAKAKAAKAKAKAAKPKDD